MTVRGSGPARGGRARAGGPLRSEWVVLGPADGSVHADEATVAAARAAAAGAGCVVTVGSGTITDIGKAAAAAGRAAGRGADRDQRQRLRRPVLRAAAGRGQADHADPLAGRADRRHRRAGRRAGRAEPGRPRRHGGDVHLRPPTGTWPRCCGADGPAVPRRRWPAWSARTASACWRSAPAWPAEPGQPGRAGPAPDAQRDRDGRDRVDRARSGMEHAVSHLLEMAAAAARPGRPACTATRSAWPASSPPPPGRTSASGSPAAALGRPRGCPIPTSDRRPDHARRSPARSDRRDGRRVLRRLRRKIRLLAAAADPLATLRDAWADSDAALGRLLAEPAELAAGLRAAGLPVRFGDLPEPVDDDAGALGGRQLRAAAAPLRRGRPGDAARRLGGRRRGRGAARPPGEPAGGPS